MKKFLFTVLLVGLTKIGLFSAVLKIRVLDGQKQPVKNAAVSILELNRLFNTSAGTEISVEVTNGVYTIIAAAEGYHKKKQAVAVNGDMVVDLVITSGTYNLGEITVFGKANKGEAVSKTKVTSEQIKETTQGFVNDVIKTLQAMPGVATSGSSFDSRMYIQGGSFWEAISGFDNMVVLNPARWGGRISIFNPNWVEHIDLYTAAYPSLYGQGLSGVINVKTKDGNTNAVGGLFDFSAATLELMLEGPFGPNDTFLVNIRRTFYDFIANTSAPGYQYPWFWDGLLKYTHFFNPNEKLAFCIYGSAEGLHLTVNGADAGDPSVDGGEFNYSTYQMIGSVNYYSKASDGNELSLYGGFTYIGQDFDFMQDISTKVKEKANQYSVQIGLNYFINSIDRHRIKFGVLGLAYKADVDMNIDQYILDYAMNWTNIANVHTTYDNLYLGYASAFAMDDIELFDRFIVQAGIRGEMYKAFLKEGHETEILYNVNPLIGLKLEFTKYWDVFVRGAMANQFPINMINLMRKDNLKDEKNYQAIIGIDFENNEYMFRMEGFYKFYYSLVETDIVDSLRNNGVRDVFGFDVFLQKKAAKNDWFNGWITYTYVNALEKITNRSPENMAQQYTDPTDQWFVPNYVRNHTVSTIFEFTYRANDSTPGLNFLNGWKLSFDIRLMSGKPYTPVTNFAQMTITNGADVYTKYLMYYGEYDSEWTPMQVNVSMKISMPYSLFSILEAFGVKDLETSSYFSFGNLLNWDNVVDYSYAVKNGVLERTDIKDLPFTFLGGMQVKF